jgi:excinuclease ABC subunit B
MTGSLTRALAETDRRRAIQREYNEKHNITPASIKKSISEILDSVYEKDSLLVEAKPLLSKAAIKKELDRMRKTMLQHAADLEFEKASALRDQIKLLEKQQLEMD